MKFKKWFLLYGINVALGNSLQGWERGEVEKIAKRAYLKGRKDALELPATKKLEKQYKNTQSLLKN